MKNDIQYTVILVDSTSHALRIEKELAKTGFKCKLVPVPRVLSSDCGVCVRILRSDKQTVMQTLANARTAYENIYDLDY
jgi:hypothetical protein